MPGKQIDEDDFEIDEAPTQIDPYEVLCLEKDATQDQVKLAYRKAALKHHPDKASAKDKDTAHTKFQEIAFAYAVLSDERRRRRYDATGRTEESLDLEDDDFDWVSFYREQFAEAVTLEKIQTFSEQYKGSDEEREHLLAAYANAKGSMSKVYQEVMLSDPADDEERFRAILDKAIADGDIEPFEKYVKESEKSRSDRMKRALQRRKDEAAEVEQAKSDVSKSKNRSTRTKQSRSSEADLAALINGRQRGRQEDFFANLEAKYAPKSRNGSKRVLGEPSEEAFTANRKKSKGSKTTT